MTTGQSSPPPSSASSSADPPADSGAVARSRGAGAGGGSGNGNAEGATTSPSRPHDGRTGTTLPTTAALSPTPRGGRGHRAEPRSEVTRGTILAFAAYGIWGLFPLYFDALIPAGAWEILAHRILWTLLFCAILLVLGRDFTWVRPLLRRPRMIGGLSIAAVLIAVNWVVYVAAVTADHTSDAALGYFLNPLVTVALGVVVLGERLRVLQWVAVAVGASAGVYLGIQGGRIPWIALTLATSFALYGLVKKKLGATLPALHGLTIETAVLAPVAVVILFVVAAHGGLAFGRYGGLHTGMLAFSGIATAIPLLFFAAAARRIPLVSIGLIQFVTPLLQLLCAVLLLGEHMPPERWVGFGIVWVALIILSVDSLVGLRRTRRTAVPVATCPS